MEKVDFHLEDVLDNLANLIGLKTEEKGLELMFDLAADLPTALIGDPLRLGRPPHQHHRHPRTRRFYHRGRAFSARARWRSARSLRGRRCAEPIVYRRSADEALPHTAPGFRQQV